MTCLLLPTVHGHGTCTTIAVLAVVGDLDASRGGNNRHLLPNNGVDRLAIYRDVLVDLGSATKTGVLRLSEVVVVAKGALQSIAEKVQAAQVRPKIIFT